MIWNGLIGVRAIKVLSCVTTKYVCLTCYAILNWNLLSTNLCVYCVVRTDLTGVYHIANNPVLFLLLMKSEFDCVAKLGD